jgi:hypothetical protein
MSEVSSSQRGGRASEAMTLRDKCILIVEDEILIAMELETVVAPREAKLSRQLALMKRSIESLRWRSMARPWTSS